MITAVFQWHIDLNNASSTYEKAKWLFFPPPLIAEALSVWSNSTCRFDHSLKHVQ